MTGRAIIAAARRTPVAPRGGALSQFQADELAAPVIRQLLSDAQIDAEAVDQVILGNALYGGGNPARLAALRAGLPVSTPALTIDTQCCSGLDAIIMGARLIEAGAARCVIAGGAESFSRAPIRMHRPLEPGKDPVAYARPPFAPPPYSDPDLTQAAADLADRFQVRREDQAEFAVQSHLKARRNAPAMKAQLVVPEGIAVFSDSFTRNLTPRMALKAPVIAGSPATGLSAATIACEADAAALVVLMSEDRADNSALHGLAIDTALSFGDDPADPALVPNTLAPRLLERARCAITDLTTVELHEAYAVQAMLSQSRLSIPPDRLNPLGGGLARGHPIGASGAILAVQLAHAGQAARQSARHAEFRGMALIAAAGGLASGAVVRAWHR